MVIHVVTPGESIYSIGKKYGVSPNKIISDNEVTNVQNLVVGQTLVILGEDKKYIVEPGDSLYSIAKKYGTTVQSILSVNPNITNPGLIYAGQTITIPPTKKIGKIEVNGYTYPNIDINVLKKTLPYLTYLSIFSYNVRPDGSLVPINDEPLIKEAINQKVAPIMVITNIEEGGSFSSDLAKTILNDEQVQNTLINNVINNLKNKNYSGVAVDFEYIYPEDKEKYNDFLRKITSKLRPLGYTVETAVAPKTSQNQPGVLYQGHDYAVHGALADKVIIMTYEWGYTYGPPLPVAPIDEVAKVLNYGVKAIPREKILMGMPNYGYDWTLPYKKGTAARTVSNKGAIELAAKTGSTIKYDKEAQAPYFNYYDNLGRGHIVWFEDARSVQAKLMLPNIYKLAGVSYWTIGKYFPQNWLVLNSMYDVVKKL